MKQLFVCLAVAASSVLTAVGQDAHQQAMMMKADAIRMVDNDSLEAGRVLLEKARQLDPGYPAYSYEIAYIYYQQQQYAKTLKLLKKIINSKWSQPVYYQLMGNSYDMLGNRKKAMATYQAGVKRFPALSGCLFLEQGNMYRTDNNFDKALQLYEEGIKVEPQYPSNYFWAAVLYCASNYPCRGMVYGEIFMNLERHGERAASMSEMLYRTYIDKIKIASDSSLSLQFVPKNVTIKMDRLGHMQIPFGVDYERLLSASIQPPFHPLDIAALSKIRTNFVENYAKQDTSRFNNVLFNFQGKIHDLGFMEPYNYWLLQAGDGDAFNQWMESHKSLWDAFSFWFSNNGIDLDGSHKFCYDNY
jgi:tetratricopeptide (TPR) repeat protein